MRQEPEQVKALISRQTDPAILSPSISEQDSVSSVVWCTWSPGTVLATAILVSLEMNDTEIMQRRAESDFYETKFRAQHATELLTLGEQNGTPLAYSQKQQRIAKPYSQIC